MDLCHTIYPTPPIMESGRNLKHVELFNRKIAANLSQQVFFFAKCHKKEILTRFAK